MSFSMSVAFCFGGKLACSDKPCCSFDCISVALWFAHYFYWTSLVACVLADLGKLLSRVNLVLQQCICLSACRLSTFLKTIRHCSCWNQCLLCLEHSPDYRVAHYISILVILFIRDQNCVESFLDIIWVGQSWGISFMRVRQACWLVLFSLQSQQQLYIFPPFFFVLPIQKKSITAPTSVILPSSARGFWLKAAISSTLPQGQRADWI